MGETLGDFAASKARKTIGYRAQRSRTRLAQLRRAAALALVEGGRAGRLNPDMVASHLPPKVRPPGYPGLWAVCGSVDKSLKEFRPDDFPVGGPWTPGFCAGLKLSGAISRYAGKSSWRIMPGRPWLVKDMLTMPVSGKVTGPWGGRYHVGDFWLPDMPFKPGADVVAGVLAGSRTKEVGGRQWVVVLPRCASLLSEWGFGRLEEVKRRICVDSDLLVSPFWAGVFASLMPPASAARAVGFRKAGACPVLPMCLWHLTLRFGSGKPCRKSVPYGCTLRNLSYRGILLGDLGRIGLETYGLSFVRPEVRKLIHRRAASKCSECGVSKGCSFLLTCFLRCDTLFSNDGGSYGDENLNRLGIAGLDA